MYAVWQDHLEILGCKVSVFFSEPPWERSVRSTCFHWWWIHAFLYKKKGVQAVVIFFLGTWLMNLIPCTATAYACWSLVTTLVQLWLWCSGYGWWSCTYKAFHLHPGPPWSHQQLSCNVCGSHHTLSINFVLSQLPNLNTILGHFSWNSPWYL